MPGLRVRDDDGAAQPFDQRGQVLRRPGVGRRELFRDRTSRRSSRAASPRRSAPAACSTRAPAGVERERAAPRVVDSAMRGVRIRDPAESPCGISRPVRTFEPAGTRWPNHAVQAPLSVIRPKLGISSAAALASPPASLRLGLVEHRLVEARAAAPGLVDHVARHAVADEVGIPALAAVGRGLEARAGVGGAVHHDHRPAAAVFLGRDLELHVHLADGDLLRHRAAGAAVPARPAAAAAACSVIFWTPPMKKLPWSSMTSGPPRNFFDVCALTRNAGGREHEQGREDERVSHGHVPFAPERRRDPCWTPDWRANNTRNGRLAPCL